MRLLEWLAENILYRDFKKFGKGRSSNCIIRKGVVQASNEHLINSLKKHGRL